VVTPVTAPRVRRVALVAGWRADLIGRDPPA
jgi:hypothetical protein